MSYMLPKGGKMTTSRESTPVARKIMTAKLLTISENESLMEAWRLMRDRRIRHLPVIAQSGGIIGILTDRDLQRAIHTEFDQAGTVRFTVEKFAADETVSDYMSNPPRYVTSDTPIVTVATQMLEQKISCLLVVESEEVVGIVTTDDLLWELVSMLGTNKEPGFRKLLSPIYTSSIGEVARRLAAAGI
jgi:acetoin utilization protein AcuB